MPTCAAKTGLLQNVTWHFFCNIVARITANTSKSESNILYIYMYKYIWRHNIYIYILYHIILYYVILHYVVVYATGLKKNRTCSRAHFRKLGWGGDNSKRVYRYAIWSSLALHATLLDFHLHFHDLHLHFMLRYLIFTCTFMIFTCTFMIFTCTSCDATWFSLVGKNPNGKYSCLLTDGDPCYPKVAKECRAKHFFVNHSAGEFQRTERFRNRALSVHTGTISQICVYIYIYYVIFYILYGIIYIYIYIYIYII